MQELERLLDAQRIRVDRLETQLREAETRASDRDRLLNERERGLDVREAKLEAEEEVRLDKLGRSEAYVEELAHASRPARRSSTPSSAWCRPTCAAATCRP